MNFTFKGGQRQAVITKVCVAGREFRSNATDEETLKGVLDGDLQIVVQQADKGLYDRNGRRIPPRGLVAAVCDPNRDYCVSQPQLDYANRLTRLQQAGLTAGITAADFEAHSSALLSAIGQDGQIKNLLKGVYLPIVIPQMVITNLGETTEKLVEAAGISYQREFTDRPFTNHRKGELAGQVSVVAGTRYEQLINQLAQGDVVGIYFPACLQGFSVDAQREQLTSLSPEFILSGCIDIPMGWAMYSDILGRDGNTPGYDGSAVQWRSSDFSLDFEASGGCAYFGRRSNLGNAYDYYSGGLFLLG